MDFLSALEKYGIIGVLVLLIPTFIKGMVAIGREIKGIVETNLEGSSLRADIRLQGELQQAVSRQEHERFMYEQTLRVLQENIEWVRSKLVDVDAVQAHKIEEISTQLKIIGAQMTMLIEAHQRLQQLLLGGDLSYTQTKPEGVWGDMADD